MTIPSICGVLFLHSKDETPQAVIDHIKLIKLDSNVPVRAIRSDNGTESNNSLSNGFCTDKGITRQYSAPRTPQQNGVVERKNQVFQCTFWLKLSVLHVILRIEL